MADHEKPTPEPTPGHSPAAASCTPLVAADAKPPGPQSDDDSSTRTPAPTPGEEATPPSPDVESSPLAWLVCLGAFLMLVPTWGMVQCVGVIQAYLQQNQLASYSSRDIGWIMGMYCFLGFLFGIQTGPLMDVYGTAVLAPAAALITVAMFFLLAECSQYWQFMLCLGALGGLSCAVAATVAVAAVGKLFFRRKGLAMGLSISGSSFAAVVIPLVLRHTFPRFGWAWSIRILGFGVAGVMAVAVVCFLPFPRLLRLATEQRRSTGRADAPALPTAAALPTTRQPTAAGGLHPVATGASAVAGLHPVGTTASTVAPAGVGDPAADRARSATINFSAFGSRPFTLVTLGIFMLEFVIYGLTGLLPTFAISAGFAPETGYALIAILNGASCVGRTLAGLVGDRVGHFNVIVVACAASLVTTGALFVPFGARSVQVLYAFSAVWGLQSGAMLTIWQVCVGATCKPEDYGRYLGTANFLVAFSLLLSIPVGGQLIDALGPTALSGLYLAVLFVGGLCYYGARSLLLESWTKVKVVL